MPRWGKAMPLTGRNPEQEQTDKWAGGGAADGQMDNEEWEINVIWG